MQYNEIKFSEKNGYYNITARAWRKRFIDYKVENVSNINTPLGEEVTEEFPLDINFDTTDFKSLLLATGAVKAFMLDDNDQTVCLIPDKDGDLIPWLLIDLDLNDEQLVAIIEKWQDAYNTANDVCGSPYEPKKFYRVANVETNQGLWYDTEGNFTGLIHDQFTFCVNTKLQMPFDPEIVGWLSATETIEDLFNWFSKSDISRLMKYGYAIVEYQAHEYKFYKNHWVISQETSVVSNRWCSESILQCSNQ